MSSKRATHHFLQGLVFINVFLHIGYVFKFDF